MTTRRQVERRARELGCSFSYEDKVAHLDAPAGRVFAGATLHFFDIYNSHGEWKMSDLYDALLEDMAMGVEDCTVSDCDVCIEARSE